MMSLPGAWRKRRVGILRAVCAGTLLATGVIPPVSYAAEAPHELFDLRGGEAIYKGVCQGCHMADAKGAMGAGSYPALANNPRLASANYVIHMVIKGRNGMPPLNHNFTDLQIADVVNYVRTNFGNHYKDKVQAADVQALR